MDLEARVKKVIAATLNVPAEHLRSEANLKDDLGATSLDRYTILMDIEAEFGLNLDDVPEEELESRFGTIGDILAFLKTRVGG